VTGTGSPVPAPDNPQHVTLPGGTREGAHGWMSGGACHGADTELFFPIATAGRALKQINSAKAVCGRCKVRADCLSYALETMQQGIWGGTTGDERAAMRAISRRALRPTARREDPPHGPRGPGILAGRSGPDPLRDSDGRAGGRCP
jgi:WhiB family redox-sensing transcriptional regulator